MFVGYKFDEAPQRRLNDVMTLKFPRIRNLLRNSKCCPLDLVVNFDLAIGMNFKPPFFPIFISLN